MEKYQENSEKYLKIKCLLFDLDNTLIETRKADSKVCDELSVLLSHKLKITSEDSQKISTNFLSNFRKCPESPPLSLEKWRTLLWSKALGEKYQQYAEYIYKQWHRLRYLYLAPTRNVTFLLEMLRKQFLIGLVSNGTSIGQWEKIDKLDLRKYFDLILVSGDLPYEKPNKLIFWNACDQLNIKPIECAMVGDKLETDIRGGIEAQLGVTIWIPQNTQYNLTPDDPHPDYILKHVVDLKNLLHSSREFEKQLDMLNCAKEKNEARLVKPTSPWSQFCNSEEKGANVQILSGKRSTSLQINQMFRPEEDSCSNGSDGS